jgi:glyoxylase-like metal-dependent hydrolase (beta-lactamase superfamily II)
MKILDNLHGFLWVDQRANNCNAYLIEGDKRILIDPGHEVFFGHIEDNLSQLSLSPSDIDLVIVTHGHPDHMEGVRKFLGNSALIAIHDAEMKFLRETSRHYGGAMGISHFEPQILLQDGDLKVGNLRLSVIHTPGHSPGSVCLYWKENKVLFTGDVVFYQGLGRTDLPGGNGQQLKESITRISRLDAEYLLPGHGAIIAGRDRVIANFQDIERAWFAYL